MHLPNRVYTQFASSFQQPPTMQNPLPIDQLKPGMYVTKIDIPWIRSPFLLHHRLIRDKEDIEALKGAGVKEVWIDPSKSITAAPPGSTDTTATAPTPQPLLRNTVKLEREIGAAKRIRQSVLNAVESTFSSLEAGKAIDTATLTPLIDDTLESLSRNDQALMALMHIQRTSRLLQQHTFGVFSLTLGLAIEMGLSTEEKRDLGMAALLHDTGWLQLPLNLFAKRHPYTDADAELVRQHVGLTAKLIAPMQNLSERTQQIIMQHHECVDGSGYPNGIGIGSMDPLATALAVADRYDTLVHGLMDNAGATPKGALGKIFLQSQQGQLPDDIVAYMIHLLGIFPVGSVVALNTGEKAIVIESHRDAHSQPTIAIFYDARGRASLDPTIVDLRQRKPPQREITTVLDVRAPGVDPARILNLESVLG